MKTLIALLVIIFMMPAFADKPDWAGKGKPSAEQREAHKAAMRAKVDEIEKDCDESEGACADIKEKVKKQKDKAKSKAKENDDDFDEESDGVEKAKGLEKQRERKTEEAMKELDKGSDQAQEARSNRKKWWKFWE